MSDFTSTEKTLDRRGFLKGSVLFAAAIGMAAAAPALAQDAQKPAEPGSEPETKTEPARKKLLDSRGREYRVCDMCGGNMYKAEKTWTCEQCGFSYEE